MRPCQFSFPVAASRRALAGLPIIFLRTFLCPPSGHELVGEHRVAELRLLFAELRLLDKDLYAAHDVGFVELFLAGDVRAVLKVLVHSVPAPLAERFRLVVFVRSVVFRFFMRGCVVLFAFSKPFDDDLRAAVPVEPANLAGEDAAVRIGIVRRLARFAIVRCFT